jgi:PAS domain S-box-containing protein
MDAPQSAVSSVDLVLGAIAHPVIRLSAAGRITSWNTHAAKHFDWLSEGAELERVAPAALAERVRITLDSNGDDVALDGFGARLLRLSDKERLLLFDLPQAAVFDELPSGMLVWEYEGDVSRDAGEIRLIAANPASESIGPRVPTRSFIGRTRAEIGPIDVLSPLYLEVAQTKQPAELELLDIKGDPFIVRIFPLPGRRIATLFEDVSALRQGEQGFRTMFDGSRDAMLIFDPREEVVLAANPAAQQIFGAGGDDIIGRKLASMFEVEPDLGRRIAEAGYLQYESKCVAGDEERRLDIRAMPVDFGRHKAVMAMITDITAAAATLKDLISRQQRYSSLIENLPVVLWTVKKGTSVFISPRSERVTGFSADEISRPDFGEVWLRNVHPEDAPHVMAAYEALFRDGTPFEAEYRFRRPDGVWRWISDYALHTYEVDGEILASGVSADITARKRAERQQFALANFGRRALRSNDDDTLLADACSTVATVLEVPSVHILRFDPATNEFHLASAHGSRYPAGTPLKAEPNQLASKVLVAGRPIVYSNLESETRFSTARLLALGVRAGVSTPISGRAARYGILHAYTTEPRSFSEHEAAFVESTANILAEAIERNRAEHELERRTAQLTDAQAVAHIGSLSIDEETSCVEGSDELYRLFGIEPQSLELTVPWLVEHMAPESRDRLLRFRERLDAQEMLDDEDVIHAVDGVRRIVHYRASRKVDKLTGKSTVIGTVQDVTAARQAEIALRDHERRLQVMVSRLPVILFSADLDLQLTSVTGEGFAPMSSAMLAGLTLADLVGPDPVGEGPQTAVEGRHATYDTKYHDREFRVHVEPLPDDVTNQPIGVVGLAFDVTEEKRAEEANRVLLEQLGEAAAHWRWTFDSIQAPLLILDAQNRVRRLNAAALRFSHFKDYRQAIDLPVTELGESLMWTAIDALTITAREQSATVGVQFIDGDRVWDLIASSSEGQTVIIVSDVTEVVKMERNLRRAEKMSEMGALVAGVAHEVRNPLFGLSATLDAFEVRFGADEYQDYVAALREQIERMSQLMHELLEYGRPVTAVLISQDLAPVLHRARDLMDTFARQSGVELRCDLPSMLPHVAMDRQRLLQVFENLLKNAVEHSTSGGEVMISANVAEGGAFVLVEVADRGPGFAPGDLERVFEPFFTKRRGGTGLGLSLASRIVEEHHGTTRASNRAGGGASMIVKLPLAERS